MLLLCSLSGLLVDFARLLYHFLALIQRLELRVREGEAQGDDEVSPAGELRDFLVRKGFNSVRGRAGDGVPQAQLAGVVRPPGVDLARSGK